MADRMTDRRLGRVALKTVTTAQFGGNCNDLGELILGLIRQPQPAFPTCSRTTLPQFRD
jgi:hypothetical protein